MLSNILVEKYGGYVKKDMSGKLQFIVDPPQVEDAPNVQINRQSQNFEFYQN